METIDLRPGVINPERVGALQSDLKSNFYDVRVKYFRADLPKGDQSRPKNIFPAEPSHSNYVTVRVSRRDCLEFYKAAFKSYALLHKNHFNAEDLRRISDSLQRTGFTRPPELPKPAMQPLPPQKNIFGELLGNSRTSLAEA